MPIILKGDIAMRENSGKNGVVGSVMTESMISSGTHKYTCPPCLVLQMKIRQQVRIPCRTSVAQTTFPCAGLPLL